MYSDFDMIVHSFPSAKSITVIPIADVHLGAAEHYAEAWNSFCKRVEANPNTYILLVGDLINNSVRNSVANPFDEVMRPRDQKRVMVEQLKPIKDRILCSVSGNHERRSLKESDADLSYDIMSKLDIEHLYRENIAFLKIEIGKRATEDKSKCSYMFGVTHGSGGGSTGASVNKNEKFGGIIEGLDCLVTGHTHKGVVSRPSKIVVNPFAEKVTIKPFTVITAESWLNYGGYAAQAMLTPAETGNPQEIILDGSRGRKSLKVLW